MKTTKSNKKRLTYAMNKSVSDKQKRARYKEAKKNGFQDRRLKFLLEFIKERGWNKKRLAEAIGITQQRLQHCIAVADDAKLSFLRMAFLAMGCKLVVELFGEKRKRIKTEYWEFISPRSVCFSPSPTDKGDLDFLRRALQDSGLSNHKVSQNAGISPLTLDRILETDDITVKNLISIADALNLKVRWKATKI